jgi:outer membrane protein OmpA-like peptidoglycan-associated protein
MKINAILTAVLLLGYGGMVACAEETADKMDVQAAKAKLDQKVKKTPGAYVVKDIGGDPATSRLITKDVVIVTRASGAKEAHPYVAIPLLFRANSDELLDESSKENVTRIAEVLKGFAGANFAIEGHASAEGDSRRNRELSQARAAKIQQLLLERGVPKELVNRVQGFGADYAQYPAYAPAAELQTDRRVLIVKDR